MSVSFGQRSHPKWIIKVHKEKTSLRPCVTDSNKCHHKIGNKIAASRHLVSSTLIDSASLKWTQIKLSHFTISVILL